MVYPVAVNGSPNSTDTCIVGSPIGKSNKTLVAFFFLMVLPLVTVFPQSPDKKPNILVYSGSIRPSDGKNLIADFNRSISHELQASEMNALVIEEETDIGSLLDTAEWLGAFFLVESRYTVENGSFQLTIDAYSTWDGKHIAGSMVEGIVGSEDAVSWNRQLRDIISAIKAYLKIIEEENISTESELAQLSEREIEILPDKDLSEEPMSMSGENLFPGIGSPDVEPEIRELHFRPYFISIGVSPLIAVGTIADVFKLGIDFNIAGGYTIPTGFGELDLGLVSSLVYFHAEGILISSENWFFSVGPDAALNIGVDSRFRLILGFTTGISWAFINAENGDRHTILSPYISGRLGGGLKFNDVFDVSFSMGYLLYFLPSMPLSGFTPALSTSFRF